ncbi:cyclic pyranopterin monophosphate synthase MoaC [Ureibacillus sinduriensis]|uniref:Cyclic pyranopterin monophosphate synthase n=1 Tax=Ureibacillus sinduriensis BLB-1 = JCM 15800 TaxID=1384057 RepID=A0A0A3I198_9BACL|nr:cyclic pyranopterin monophosphate synthase MoaC [Ureibacillus sinduriensis]KGR78611.1 molybdenum cofactor biosynthesis protein C [Ureibacillus sinduriensis BLB-1 = JCM 15800]
MAKLTHFNEQGRAQMVDISRKEESVRVAIALSSIKVNKEIYEEIKNGTNKKGDVLSVAQVAGIMAAKQTSNIIPMCHPISLTGVNISFDYNVDNEADQYEITIQAEVKTKGSTGVEMEALTAVSATALTIYDMCKAVDKNMIIGPTMLMKKTGGKSGDFLR